MAKMNPSKLRNVLEALPSCNLSGTKKEAIDTIITRYLNGDIVSVVRCKDCYWSRQPNRKDPYEDSFIDGVVWCIDRQEGMMQDDFCSYGRMKEGESDDL